MLYNKFQDPGLSKALEKQFGYIPGIHDQKYIEVHVYHKDMRRHTLFPSG
jgi:hypothetical protein